MKPNETRPRDNDAPILLLGSCPGHLLYPAGVHGARPGQGCRHTTDPLPPPAASRKRSSPCARCSRSRRSTPTCSFSTAWPHWKPPSSPAVPPVAANIHSFLALMQARKRWTGDCRLTRSIHISAHSHAHPASTLPPATARPSSGRALLPVPGEKRNRHGVSSSDLFVPMIVMALCLPRLPLHPPRRENPPHTYRQRPREQISPPAIGGCQKTRGSVVFPDAEVPRSRDMDHEDRDPSKHFRPAANASVPSAASGPCVNRPRRCRGADGKGTCRTTSRPFQGLSRLVL